MDGLKRFWSAWKKFGQFLGDWVARIVLTVFYFTIFLPFGLGVRLFSDPLKIKPGYPLQWQERKTRDLSIENGWRLH